MIHHYESCTVGHMGQNKTREILKKKNVLDCTLLWVRTQSQFNVAYQHQSLRLTSVGVCKSLLRAHHKLNRINTIRDAILTCARKPTWVSLIYRTEPTTKKCKTEKTKSRKQICSEITVNSPGNPRSKYLSRKKERLQWERFAEKEGFKPGEKEWVGDGIANNSKYDCWQITTV